ncbi:M16 family metallopeptidase [Anaeromyxobacter oryzae]|uniref:Peptidase M16 domain protein n=1 Tax=Anaeromyxobacter oryzae TaxID=2918170 RepID=A0ABN6MVC1_9BACT|nr:M16 family metallopeptidase [Anaeromyxobacter oryzae]BDG03787.1 hypothetical protein AMOR_27830 [Anaeromyxobacter oryzae]
MTRRARVALPAVILAALGLACAAHQRYVPKGRPVPYQGFFATFPSGLRLVVYEVPQVDRFAVTVSYGSGSAADPAGKDGLAHLAEHLAFRAAPPWAQGARIWDGLLEAGFRFNAETSPDSTDFWAAGKPANLRTALALEASRMRDPLVGVTDDDFAVERDVVLAEYRERFENDPVGAQLAWLRTEAFGDHPYGRTGAGTPESLRAITLADVRAWAKAEYVPRNAIVVVIAPRSTREVTELVLDTFGPLTGDGEATRVQPVARSAPPVPPPPDDEIAPASRTAPVRQPVVWVAWRVPGDAAGEEPKAQFAAAAIDAAFSVKLVQAFGGNASEVVERFDAFYEGFGGAGLVVFRAELARAGDAGKVIDLVKSAAFEVRAEDELRDPAVTRLPYAIGNRLRANVAVSTRDRLLVKGYLAMESIDGSQVARFLRATGQPDFLAGWQRLVAGQLHGVPTDYLNEHLRREQAVALVVLPDRDAPARALGDLASVRGERRDDSEDPSVGPAPGPEEALAVARPPNLAAAERRVLANGLAVVVARRGNLPVAQVDLVVRTRAEGTPEIPPGLPALALGSNQAYFAEHDLERIGADAETRRTGEALHRVARGTSANLDVLLQSTAEWARDQTPRWFDGAHEAFTRRLARLEKDVDFAAARALAAALFPGHPYGASPSADVIGRLASGDASRWLSEEIRPERARLVVVSDQDPSPELWAAIEGHFGGWARGGRDRIPPPPPPVPAARRVLLLDRPGATQAVVLAAFRAPPRAERDEAATEAVRWLLRTRLNQKIRIEEGVSYGVAVSLLDHERGAALLARAAVDRDATVLALRTILGAVERLGAAPLQPAEAARARWQVARAYGSAFDTVDATAAALVTEATYDLPPDHWDRQPAEIAALSPERIQKAAAALALGREVILVVGDAAALRPQLEKAGYAVEAAR